MKYSLLDNGIDSLKAAYNCLEKLPDLKEGIEHNVKDAIISLNHALEILFKLLLKNEQEYLIFTDLKLYMNAKERMIREGKENVFEVNPELKTVSLLEAMRRTELLCEIEIPSNLSAAISYINKIRNQIMHYGIELDDEQRDELINKLKSCYELSIDFFEENIGDVEELLETARFEETLQDYWSDMAEYQAELMYEEYKLGLYDVRD